LPFSNLSKPVDNRRALDQVKSKSQLWAGFLITAITFLLGFFQSDLSKAETLIITFGVSLFLFVASMEFSDYAETKLHVTFAVSTYYVSAIALFLGISYYANQVGSLGLLSILFLIPSIFYGILLILEWKIAIMIYRR